MAFISSIKLVANMAAIRVALDFNGQSLSENEVSALSKYVGFGGIKAVMFPAGDISAWENYNASEADKKLHPQIMQLHDLLKEKLSEKDYKAAIDSIRNSVLTAFYTPDFVPEMIYWALKENNILPKRIYDPSAGAGVFITEAIKNFPDTRVSAVEKDWLTGKVLTALCAGLKIPAEIQIKGLEETGAGEKGQSDLVISNIPFGNFSVHDPAFGNSGITSRIHNYFFAKGLDKLADGGILAYLVTDGFLNSPSNETARKYLLTAANLLSVSVLPANLMKENAGVEVGTHLVIVQKDDHKQELSDAESLMIGTVERENEYGKYHLNAYLSANPELVLGDEIFEGTNAYGQAARTIWQTGEMLQIAGPLMGQVESGLSRVDLKKWNAISFSGIRKPGRQFTFLKVPEKLPGNAVGQLGLFDAVPAGNNNQARAYLSDVDGAIVDENTVRQISTIRTTDQPLHDSIVLLTARAKTNGRYLYKLYSNVAEISSPLRWLNGLSLGNELAALAARLNISHMTIGTKEIPASSQLLNYLPTGPKHSLI